MPLRDSLDGSLATGGIDLTPPESDVGFLDAIGPAFRVDNVVGSIAQTAGDGQEIDLEFNALTAAQEAGVADHFESFTGARNQKDFNIRLERFHREREDRQLLDQAGGSGFLASMVAAGVDLPSLIPGGQIVQGGRAANAGRLAFGAGVAAGTAEAALQGSQTQRTAEESAFAVGGSVILGAALGSVLGRAMTPEEFKSASAQVEQLPANLQEANKSLSAAANIARQDAEAGRPFELRREGIFNFMRKFPGGYMGDVAEKYGAPGVAVVLEKFSPLAPLTRMTPLVRGQLQSSQVGREITADLAETPLQYKLNEAGNVISDGGSVETRAKYRVQAMLNENLTEIRSAYANYWADGPVGAIGTVVAPFTSRVAHLAGRSEKLTLREFSEEVGRAMFMKDMHSIKQVRDLAETLRGRVYNPIAKEMVDVGFFDDLPFKPQFGESYMTRRYRHDKILENEPAVISRLVKEFKRNQQAARLRLKEAEIEGEPPKASDEHIVGLDDSEIEKAVQDTLRSIKGLRPGDSFVTAMRSNPMRARVLDVHDEVLLDMGILETDIGVLTESYIRAAVPRIELQRKFGSLDLKADLERMGVEYAQLRDEASSAPRRRQLEIEENARRADIEGIRDRVLGVYDMPRNPDDVWSRAGEAAKSLSYMQLLGMQVTSALPDLSGLVSRAGLKEFAGGVVEMASNMPTFAKNAKEAAELLHAIEIVGNTRTRALAELNTRFTGGSMAERAIEGGSSVFSHATGITFWNAGWKSIANLMIMSKILKAADASVRGKATKKQKIALAENSITPEIAARMMKQFEKHGEKGKALWFAKAGNWDDSEAFRMGQQAMSREADIAVITPGQDKPLWMSNRLGSFFLQFKSFGVAANERIVLSGLQRADADVMAQFAMLFALGAAVSNLRADLSGRPRKEGQALIIDAIDRAGPFQIAFEANAIAEAAGLGVASQFGGELPSRFQSRSSILGALGPSTDMAVTLLEVSRKANTDDGVNSRDVDKITRLIPGQNTPYGMIFRDDIRQGIASVLGTDYER